MKKQKWLTRLACMGLIAAVIAGAALAAGTQGSQDDPLITLSYLNDVAVPEILKQVDARVKEKAEAVKKELGENGAAFRVVELKKDKTLELTAGCQFILRSGVLNSTDALVDLSSGETWAGGGSLLANHLYIATGGKQTVTAAEAVVLLVQGGCKTK